MNDMKIINMANFLGFASELAELIRLQTNNYTPTRADNDMNMQSIYMLSEILQHYSSLASSFLSDNRKNHEFIKEFMSKSIKDILENEEVMQSFGKMSLLAEKTLQRGLELCKT